VGSVKNVPSIFRQVWFIRRLHDEAGSTSALLALIKH